MIFSRTAVLALAGLLALAGCGGSTAADESSAVGGTGIAEGGVIHIVTSTNVWGDIAATVAGKRAEVTSLIADLSRDPHDFEPSGRDELALSRADLVIVNGGGYDDFIDQMLSSLDQHPATIRAVDIAARTDDNEHVWFDPAVAAAVADAIATGLGQIDPGHASDYDAGAAAFADSLADARDQLASIAEHYPATPVAVAEPAPVPLIEAAGMVNIIDDSFTEAMEEGVDVPPGELAAVLDRIRQHDADLLVYNVQSATPQSEQLRAAAETADVPVVEVTELLPPDTGYAAWIDGIIDAMIRHLQAAVSTP